MRFVAASKKGGVGKTTTVMYIAQALSALGSVEVWDADPQGSATEWAFSADENGTPLPYSVVTVNVRDLARKSNRSDYVVIDTPPGYPDIIEAAFSKADAVIVCTGAAAMDMAQTWVTLDLAANIPSVVLITRSNPRTKAHQAAVATLEAEGATVFPQSIPQREAIKTSFGGRIQNLHGYDTVVNDLIEAIRLINTQEGEQA